VTVDETCSAWRLDELAETSPLLVLAPASERGWFGGCGLVASGGAVEPAGCLGEAAEALESAFAGQSPPVAVLLPYEGPPSIVRFERVGPVAARALAARLAARAASPETPLLEDARSDLTEAAFRARVLEVRERIAAGDVYVLNLTRRLSGRPSRAPLDAFAELVARASSDMNALLLTPEHALVSVSPERFVRVLAQPDGSRSIEVCPIKGTRPRGSDPERDRALACELLADAKELAEHVMVVDLERNDIGRVCEAGSVTVQPLYEVVATPYCHQLVSTVRGVMRRDASIAQLLEAAFPCGSVTGAPKIAAMRITAGLEASARRAYCGSLLVAAAGGLDSSVLIRTLEYHAEGTASWGTGCGVTIDSDPAAEWLESELKALPVLGRGSPVARAHVWPVAHSDGRTPGRGGVG
jgi:anthranilate/para-aminobenzoate synthase component I